MRKFNLLNTIKFRFTFLIITISLLLYFFIVTFVIIRFREESVDKARLLTENLAKNFANMATADLNVDMNLCRGMSLAFESNCQNGRPDDENFYKAMLNNVALESNDIYAVWVNLELSTINQEWKKSYGRQRFTLVTLKGQEDFISEQLNLEGDDTESDYFKLKKSKIFEFSEPYFDSYGTDPRVYLMSSVCAPILDGKGNFIGLSGFDFSLDRLAPFVEQLNPYTGTVATVVSNKGVVVAHPDKKLVMKSIDEVLPGVKSILTSVENGENKSFDHIFRGDKYFVAMAPIKLSKSITPWSLILQIPQKSVLSTVNSTILFTVIICILGLIVLGGIIYYLTRRIEKPLKQCIRFAAEVGEGKLSENLKIDSKDEIGEMSDSLNLMANHLRAMVGSISEGAVLLSQTAGKLAKSSNEMISVADEQEHSSSNVERSVNELSGYINKSTGNSEIAAELSAKTTKNVVLSSDKFHLSDQSIQDISEKIKIINDIAFQTNILALNAAVEASRAGEWGRGFAVVAGEVRRLADSSKNAADEIMKLASETQQNSAEAGETLDVTFSLIGEYSSIVDEIHKHALIQNDRISEITESVDRLKSMSHSNTLHAANIDQFATELKNQSEKLMNLVMKFKK